MEKSNAHVFMNKKKISLFLITALLILGTLFVLNYQIKKEKILIIKEFEEGNKWEIPVEDRKFVLSFIHSVHRTPVYEYFEIAEDNRLVMYETRFYSLGVGMPFTEEGGSFVNEEGEFVLRFRRDFAKITLRASPIPEHTIRIGEKVYPLLHFVKPENKVEIYASDKWVIRGMYKGRGR